MDIISFQPLLEKQRGFGRDELEQIRSPLSLLFLHVPLEPDESANAGEFAHRFHQDSPSR
jgi:hypothetical protein